MVDPKTLEIALRIAVNAHFGQVDRSGMPTIFHALRVMNSMDTLDEKVVAILQDVVNDSEIWFKEIQDKGIPKYLMDILHLLLGYNSDGYENYIKGVSENEIARKVKLAALKDNIERLHYNRERFEKYTKAIEFLESVK